ncbi:isopentenyl-diphosphate Delta-isomerase [Patescibacteria group bacterium]|nr:isopentenyl-diphosphate Delta-isomerase [Patescibacteria group bacterium]
MEEKIILVDKNDCEIGLGEKLKVHQEGKLHRAFSIFVFNSKGKLMLQQRAKSKYHSGGLWTNTCCSHPRAGEKIESAAHRRLKEEMGFDCEVKEIFSFIYKAKLDHGLWEYEFDHIFAGKFDGEPKINPEEADGWKWTELSDLKKDILKNPKNYTVWFKIAADKNHEVFTKRVKGFIV